MSLALRKVPVADIARFADRLDARSPAEFAIDRLPGATSAPVLSDAERATIGTLHSQVSAFAARRAGAAMVARNIATIVDTIARDRPIGWAPLVYCWRGGQRSRALVHVLNEIGFRAMQLDGGYRAFRRHVVDALATRPAAFEFVVICGLTGAGKSRLIAALSAAGAQALDLEGLAHHRGSLLGDDPHEPQPSQKHFETGLFAALESFDPARPVFVESESRRIGRLQVPEALLAAMRTGRCIRLATPLPMRVELLLHDYAHWRADVAALEARLAPLAPLVGKEAIARWRDAARAGDFAALVGELLALHYDPGYARAIAQNFPQLAHAPALAPRALDTHAFAALAREAIDLAHNPHLRKE
jgi:tRNA 2-selenouridine synthase